jgi:urease accessory protein
MTTDPVLTLAQWLSPAFPLGAFSYSHGLEAAFHAGWITDGASLSDWLRDLVSLGSGQADARLVAAAWNGDLPVAEIDAIARAFAPSAERLLETEAQGRAFAEVVGPIWGGDLEGLSYPVALGHAAAREGLPLELTLRMFLQAMVANLVSAAQRLGPIGQTEAQAIVRDLAPLCSEIAGAVADGDLSELASAAFLSDIAAMRHETLYSRIFRS